MKVIYSFYRILGTMHSSQIFLFIGNIKKQLVHPGVSLNKLINDICLVIGKKNWVQSTCNQYRSLKGTFFFLFFFCFFIRVFYHTHSYWTRQRGKGECHSFSVLQYHPLTNIEKFILLRCLTPVFRLINVLLPDWESNES